MEENTLTVYASDIKSAGNNTVQVRKRTEYFDLGLTLELPDFRPQGSYPRSKIRESENYLTVEDLDDLLTPAWDVGQYYYMDNTVILPESKYGYVPVGFSGTEEKLLPSFNGPILKKVAKLICSFASFAPKNQRFYTTKGSDIKFTRKELAQEFFKDQEIIIEYGNIA